MKSKNTKKKKSPLMMFAFFMIFIGILILLYPIIGNYIANRERSQASTSYDQTMTKMSDAEKKKQYELAKKYNEYIFKKQQGENPEPVSYDNVMEDSSEVMGTIDIPAIDVKNMPFFHGTSYETLDKGLGHYEPSSIPIGGKNTRSVITGHSGVKNQVLFTEVRNLSEGDIFYINILGKRLAYQIESMEEILPSEVDKVKIVPGQDEVTLLTCTPPGINTFRLLVNGRRIPYKEAQKNKIVKRNLWSYQTVVLFALGVNVILFLSLFLLYRFWKKRMNDVDIDNSERGRKNLRRLLIVTRIYFVLIFIAMMGLLASAVYGYTQMQKDTKFSAIDVGAQETLSDYNLSKIEKANYEEKQIASVNVGDYAKAKTVIQSTTNQWGIGKLVIPEVNIDLPILAGLNNDNLLIGAATYSPDQQMGKENYVLLSHNIYDQDLLLHRIMYLKEGDNIYTSDFKNIYVYSTTVNKVIEDTEVSYIEKGASGSTPILTLIRCEGDIGTKYRRVVQGKLASVQPISEADSNQMQTLGLEKNDKKANGKVMNQSPISYFQEFTMLVGARFVQDPLQTILPMLIFLLLPILFWSLIR